MLLNQEEEMLPVPTIWILGVVLQGNTAMRTLRRSTRVAKMPPGRKTPMPGLQW